MKNFYPTYLYIKTHNITGLKYFGKTTNDPHRYYGSGKHWIAHLKKHGYNITTEVFGYFECPEDCKNAATQFSINNKIVESKQWANIIAENGLDGGNTGRKNYKPHTQEARDKMSASTKGQLAWNKGIKGSTIGNFSPRSEETKEKLRQANLGKTASQETREKMSKARKGKERPEAVLWLTGRPVSNVTRAKMSKSNKGKYVSEETKEKLRQANLGKTCSEETKKKLSGSVVVVDKDGNCCKISKEDYHSQPNTGNERDYVFHNSKEGSRRKQA